MLRVLRRFLLLVLALLLPVYAVSLTERLDVPPQWRDIQIGDGHAEVRARLRASGLGDRQCEWAMESRIVRCTLMGRHHACGVAVRFDGGGLDARVAEVQVGGPIYTGPFHWHARLRRALSDGMPMGGTGVR